jgi:hypothetical protein
MDPIAGRAEMLHGRWREAYDMWLKDGEFSRIEEHYVAFMLATEKIINKGASAEMPKLPRRDLERSRVPEGGWAGTQPTFRFVTRRLPTCCRREKQNGAANAMRSCLVESQ